MYGRPQQGDPNLAQSIRYLNDRIDRLEGASGGIGDAKVIENVSLVTGNNTIKHGLGRKPSSWWVASPRGAFPSGGGGGGGGSIYLPPKPTRIVASATANPSSSVTSFSLSIASQPTVGNYILLQVAVEDDGTVGTYPTIGSVSGSGVTWTFVGKVVYQPSSSILYATELWIGQVTSTPITSITVTFASAFGSSYYWSGMVTEVPGINGTVSAIATGDLNSIRSGYSILYFADTTTTRSVLVEPTPAVGQILYCLMTDYGTNLTFGGSNGWDMIGNSPKGTGSPTMFAHIKRAQYAEPHPLIVSRTSTVDFQTIYVVLDSDDAAISSGGSSGDTPHGFREISTSATDLVIESLSDVTADIIVR
jgi:hypothetical protein